MGNNLAKNMDKIKIIKTEQDYQEALKMVEELIAHDPNPDSVEGEQLSLLTTLIQGYESRVFPKSLPDPIEAIKFRMEQANLKPADLIPYIGSRSRVSEILSGKRQLTLDMVRALSEGLGIPAEVLIRKPELGEDSEYNVWDNGLLKEMNKRGYFGNIGIREVVGKNDKSIDKIINTESEIEERATLIFGDVYYTDEAIDIIIKDKSKIMFFGRWNKSRTTGKPWGEMFAIKLNKELIEKAKELKLMSSKMKRCGEWEFYRYINGYNLKKQFVDKNFTNIDDWTEDFDTPLDYKRWIEKKGLDNN